MIDLQGIVDTIVKEVNPIRIILFGSYAVGNAHDHSDVDLCIIEKEEFDATHSRRKEAAKLYRALASYPVPKDLLLFSENELHQQNNQHLLQPIQQHGKILYESA